MPFTKMDDEELGDDSSDSGRDDATVEHWEYESAETTFKREKLSPQALIVLDALVTAGATRFCVNYNGGDDEGFAHADGAWFDRDFKTIEALLELLAQADVVNALRETKGKGSMWWNSADFYGSNDGMKLAPYAIAELAQDLAAELLGRGFGTGDYQLYGAFTADLNTCEITDDPNATKTSDTY